MITDTNTTQMSSTLTGAEGSDTPLHACRRQQSRASFVKTDTKLSRTHSLAHIIELDGERHKESS